jgi:hypothetical protein
MGEENIEKFDFESLRTKISEDFHNSLRSIMQWERNEKAKIQRTARLEEEEVKASTDQRNTPQRLKDIETMKKLRLEDVAIQFRDMVKDNMENFKESVAKFESDQKANKTASEITQADIDKIIKQAEIDLGVKSDSEIEKELDERERKWTRNNQES